MLEVAKTSEYSASANLMKSVWNKDTFIKKMMSDFIILMSLLE